MTDYFELENYFELEIESLSNGCLAIIINMKQKVIIIKIYRSIETY